MQFFHRLLAIFRSLRYPGSHRYWERRYAQGGDSGAGSSGVLAAYKATVLNDFVQKHNINTVVELGCGDGQQLELANYTAFTGLDIAASAVERCRVLFAGDANKRFVVYNPDQFTPADYQSELALSLEVIFHLTEDRLYHLYLNHLFALSQRWVIIFSSNEPDTTGGIFPHFRPRAFSADVPGGWVLRERIINPHRDRSISDFFVFENMSHTEF